MIVCDVMCLSIQHCLYFLFFFKQKTAYEMRISDWSSDVCSSDNDATAIGSGSAANAGRDFILANADDLGDVLAGDAASSDAAGGNAVVTNDAVADLGGRATAGNDDITAGGGHATRRTPCRARLCQYGLIPGVSGTLKTK